MADWTFSCRRILIPSRTKGEIDLRTTVTSLFETDNLQGVLHLLSDYREAAGLQQSEFVRGACWISKLTEIQ